MNLNNTKKQGGGKQMATTKERAKKDFMRVLGHLSDQPDFLDFYRDFLDFTEKNPREIKISELYPMNKFPGINWENSKFMKKFLQTVLTLQRSMTEQCQNMDEEKENLIKELSFYKALAYSLEGTLEAEIGINV
jgi:hypothetical protein